MGKPKSVPMGLPRPLPPPEGLGLGRGREEERVFPLSRGHLRGTFFGCGRFWRPPPKGFLSKVAPPKGVVKKNLPQPESNPLVYMVGGNLRRTLLGEVWLVPVLC